jgi:hypothetical protein
MPTRLRRSCAAIGLVCCSVLLAGEAAQRYGLNPKLQTQRVELPGRFSLDCPRRDWTVVPAAGAVAIVLAERRGDAAITVERSPLHQALEREEITGLFAELEADLVKQREPQSSGWRFDVIDAGARRLVVVEYDRPGVRGPDHVRQYSIPSGDTLYRLSCSAAQKDFGRFDAVFAHVAASFEPAGPGRTD